MAKPVTVDQRSFPEKVLKVKQPVLVDFWAQWCGPCRAVAPIIEELANEYEDRVTFAKVNVDENPFLASSYGVMAIPTLIIFKDGKPVERVVGFKPKAELKRLLDSVLVRQN